MTVTLTTREAIARAAGALFEQHGYTGTSVRAVAAEAGVDPALVIRHFGSKEKLFLDTMDLQGHFGGATLGPLEELGERLVATLLGPGRDVRFSAYRAMVRASDSDLVRARLIDALEEMFVGPLTPRLPGPDAELRARLIGAQVAGLLDQMALVEDPVLVSVVPARLARTYGAAIQALVAMPDRPEVHDS